MKPNSSSSSENEVDSMPYNPGNVLLSEEDVKKLLSDNDVKENINDISQYRMAFVHKSYCTRRNDNFISGNTHCPSNCLALQECSNERLEFLGDSVLNLIVAHYLYERFPDSEEGFLTKIRTRLVNGTMLANLSHKIGLDRYIMISKQIDENGGRTNQKILEDTFEAFLGAIFLDFGSRGFEVCYEFIVNVIENHVDFSELINMNNNFKDMLLKYFQHTYNYLPKFYELNLETNGNTKIYTICVKNKDNVMVSTGTGTNKKRAENDAAKNALIYYGQL
jgi:ribonuclease-3